MPGVVVADDAMIEKIIGDQPLEPAPNVAFVPESFMPLTESYRYPTRMLPM